VALDDDGLVAARDRRLRVRPRRLDPAALELGGARRGRAAGGGDALLDRLDDRQLHLFQGPQRVWVPIVVSAVVGFLFVLLGLWAWRRDPLDGAAVPAVPVPAPVAPATAATPE
jgi:hypothetical protein